MVFPARDLWAALAGMLRIARITRNMSWVIQNKRHPANPSSSFHPRKEAPMLEAFIATVS